MNEFSPVWDPSFQCESLQEYFYLWEKYSLYIECNTKLLDVTLEDSYRRQPNAMDIFDKFITKTSPGKIEDSSSRKGNLLGIHDSIEWLISSMSLQFHIKLPRVPLKLFFGESIDSHRRELILLYILVYDDKILQLGKLTLLTLFWCTWWDPHRTELIHLHKV